MTSKFVRFLTFRSRNMQCTCKLKKKNLCCVIYKLRNFELFQIVFLL